MSVLVAARELHTGAVASAKRRYANYRKSVDEQIAKGHLAGAGVVGAEGGPEGPRPGVGCVKVV